MPDAFKHKFNEKAIQQLGKQLALHAEPLSLTFSTDAFIAQAAENLNQLELKARSAQITQALLKHLPDNLLTLTPLIENILDPLTDKPSCSETIEFEVSDSGLAGWIVMPIADWVTELTLRNIDAYFDTGMHLLKECTRRFSAEFAIRPLLRDHPVNTLAMLRKWLSSEDVHVRRLVSEGSRPYLPWGIRLKSFVAEPNLILPLLDALKDDESEYVRRSVANSLNDIAKDHPDLVADITTVWWDENKPQRIKLLKHACRTLIKNGHPVVLSLLGYKPIQVDSVELELSNSVVSIGESQEMTIRLKSTVKKAQKLLIDYAVHHTKANGKTSPKVFKWTSVNLPANEAITLHKRHSFKVVTTRKYYPGTHRIEILINGKSTTSADFSLQLEG